MDLDSDDPWGLDPNRNGRGEGAYEPMLAEPEASDLDTDPDADDPEIDDMKRLQIDYGNKTGADVVPDWGDGDDPGGLGCLKGMLSVAGVYTLLILLAVAIQALR